MSHRSIRLPIVLLLILPAIAAAQSNVDYVIHISVDGLRGAVIGQLGRSQLPNFFAMRDAGATTDNARTDYDITVTMPNHVAMITGRGVHGPSGHHVTRNGDPGGGGRVPGSVKITQVPGEFIRGSGALRIDDGSGPNFVDVANAVIKPNQNAFTISTWYRYRDIANNGSDTRNFIWETSDPANSNYATGFELNAGRAYARWWINDAASGAFNGSNGTPDDGLWHHVAVSWSRSSRRIRFYWDGVLRSTTATTGVELLTSDGIHIGNHRAGDGSRNWDGFIDDFAVFDSELSATQVKSLHSGSSSPQTVHLGHLVAHWPFDRDYSSTVNNTLYQGRPVITSGGDITVHSDSKAAGGPAYIESTFDVVHDHGLRTGFYSGWRGFNFLDRSWNATNGRVDTIGADNGRDKIDDYVLVTNDDLVAQTTTLISAMTANPYHYVLLHWHKCDGVGHGFGWASSQYLQAVRDVDSQLGRLMAFVQGNSRLRNRTAIILTADHGGSGRGHGTPTILETYRIPFYVWVPGVSRGEDLYVINASKRRSPGVSRPTYAATVQPIRNGDSGNLALQLLGFPALQGSMINSAQDLAIRGTGGSADTLIAYWSFDSDFKNATGDVGYDGKAISTNATGTVTITQTAGEFVRGTGALRIDGGTSGAHYVDITKDVMTKWNATAGAFTIVAWYRHRDLNGNGTDSRNFLWETEPSWASGFEVRPNLTPGYARWWVRNGGAWRNGNNGISDDGKWHHVAITWDRSAQTVQFYWDGVLNGTDKHAQYGNPLIQSNGFHIGNHRAGDGARNWDGFIDDFAVFAEVLPACYIKGLFDGSQLINAGASCYGTGCHKLRIGNRDRASVGGNGSPNFAILLAGAPATKPAMCCLGLNSASIDLKIINAPGCFVLNSLDVYLASQTDSSGNAIQPLPIPPVPSLAGFSFFAEWYVVDPAINALGLATSDGLAVKILK